MSELRTVEWTNGRVRMIDQTKLPYKFVYVSYKNYREIARAIREMVVRGAPAIGVAAAMGIALAANSSHAKTKQQLISELETAAEVLRKSRPTAWNLFWAVEKNPGAMAFTLIFPPHSLARWTASHWVKLFTAAFAAE